MNFYFYKCFKDIDLSLRKAAEKSLLLLFATYFCHKVYLSFVRLFFYFLDFCQRFCLVTTEAGMPYKQFIFSFAEAY